MEKVKVLITHIVNINFPIWVGCYFIDAWGIKQEFIEKTPIITNKDIEIDSKFPIEGVIACKIIKISHDSEKREIITIDTKQPWGCESISGLSRFDILRNQLIS